MMYLIKIGGSILTDKASYMKYNLKNIKKISEKLSKITSDFILVHGAGSFGHAPVLKYDLNDGVRTKEQKIGYCITHNAVSNLSNIFVNNLIRNNVSAISFSTNTLITQENRLIKKFDLSKVKYALNRGYVPVLYGDMVFDEILGASVVSGDQIMSFLSRKFNPKLSIYVTDVKGIYDKNNEIIPLINKENIAEYEPCLFIDEKKDVTKGMYGKVKEIMKCSCLSVITDMDNLEKIIDGQRVGTYIE